MHATSCALNFGRAYCSCHVGTPSEPSDTRSAASDREWAGSWVRDANNIELVNAVRKVVMISMSLTGSGTYTHDDYDDAMAALNELFRRAA